jgi:hypothetical protein
VGADVDERAAAGQLRAREPAAERGDPGAAQPRRLRVVGPAEPPGVEHGLELPDVPALAAVEGSVEDAVRAPRGRDHLLGLLRGAGDRLLRERVDAAVQRGDGDRRVQEGGDRDADRVQPVDLQQVLPARDQALHAVALARLAQHRLLHARDGDDLRARQRVIRREVLLARPADADHADAQGRLPRAHS